MSTMVSSQLDTFNHLAGYYQDDAFTLAYYLLGDEARALEVVDTAFAHLYRRMGREVADRRSADQRSADQRSGDQFRLEVLHHIFAICFEEQKMSSNVGWAGARALEALCRQLLNLKEKERAAVVLVDVLGLTYDEAAQVMGCWKKQLGKLLAQARVSLSREPGVRV